MNRVFILVLIALAACVAGCGSSPPARFYMLRAEVTPLEVRSSVSVVVGPVALPAVVDRPQIVVSTGPYEVQLDELNRWAAPLQDELARTVAQNLAALLGTTRVMLFSQALNVDEDYRLAIDIRSFESVTGSSATLDAVWTVKRIKDGKSRTGRTSVRESVRDDGYDALAAAHSRAVARMSRDIADAVQSMQRE
jgi:uncharacterized lipoprotein YmbA